MYYIEKKEKGYEGYFSTVKEPSDFVRKESLSKNELIIWLIIKACTINQEKIGLKDIIFIDLTTKTISQPSQKTFEQQRDLNNIKITMSNGI